MQEKTGVYLPTLGYFVLCCKPKSQQSKQKFCRDYRDRIQVAAERTLPSPLSSSNIEVDIVFAERSTSRPDVNNIAKPILDALKGIAYGDDKQVRSVRVTAIPTDDSLRAINGIRHRTFARLLDQDQVLIRLFEAPSLTLARQLESS